MEQQTTKILYVRVSSEGQNTDRQTQHAKDYAKVIEDKVSGKVAFFDRPGGQQVKALIDKGVKFQLEVHCVDRLGRDIINILETIRFLNSKGVPVHFLDMGLTTINKDGKENYITTMIISFLAPIAEMERMHSKERQREGIAVAKMKGVYKGRKKGTKEDALRFLNKHSKAVAYLNKGMSGIEVSKLCEISPNTVVKIRKAMSLNTD